MKSEIKLKCSKKYESNLKNTFNFVETTNEEKTIIVNDEFTCDFDPNLYVEQRIFRCLDKHEQTLLESDKIKLMISLNSKTKRFLTDCDQSLFEDFSKLSDVDCNTFYDKNSKIFEKSYKETLFEASLFSDIEQIDNIAIIKTSKKFLNKNEKTIACLIQTLKQFYNVCDVEYFVIEIKNNSRKNILIYSLKQNLDNFYIQECEMEKDGNVCYIETKNKFKLNKILTELKEYRSFD